MISRGCNIKKNVKEFVKICTECLDLPEPIYEFGSFQVDGQEKIADLRPLFPEKEFVGADMREGKGVDKVLDLHNIDLPSGSVGTVICLETLEHVEYPHLALSEIHRVLKDDGIAIISSMMDFPIHDHPYDYWRFTPYAFRSILQNFCECFIGFGGKSIQPHTVVGIGFKKQGCDLTRFNRRYKKWKIRHEFDLKLIGKNITPPILLPIFKYIYFTILKLK